MVIVDILFVYLVAIFDSNDAALERVTCFDRPSILLVRPPLPCCWVDWSSASRNVSPAVVVGHDTVLALDIEP